MKIITYIITIVILSSIVMGTLSYGGDLVLNAEVVNSGKTQGGEITAYISITNRIIPLTLESALEQEVIESDFVAISIILGTLTILSTIAIFLLGNKWTKMFFTLGTLGLIMADFFIARTIVSVGSPTSTGLIRILDVFFQISMWAFILAAIGIVLYTLLITFVYFRDVSKNKRRDKQEEFYNVKWR